MNNKELHNKSVKELKAYEVELREKISKKSFNLKKGGEKQSHELGLLRKEVARTLTLLAQK